jgi:flagellar protein FlgJ
MMPEEFVSFMAPYAEKIAEASGIPIEVMVAQAALETGWLNTMVRDKYTGKLYNNLFNLIGKGPAGDVVADDLEYYKGWPRRVEAQFRAYNTFEESFEDYAALLNQPRYASAMAVREDPLAFARELHRSGYATDPAYSRKLEWIMRKYLGVGQE